MSRNREEETPTRKGSYSRVREHEPFARLQSVPDARPQWDHKPASGKRKVGKGVNGTAETHMRISRRKKNMLPEERHRALRGYEYLLGKGVDGGGTKRRLHKGGQCTPARQHLPWCCCPWIQNPLSIITLF